MRRWIPRTLIVLSLLLHLFTAACYIRQPDKMAAFTVYPIWMWGLLGIFLSSIAFIFWRARLSLMLSAIWAMTILLGSDETHALARIGNERPEAGPAKPYAAQDTLRICTLNWGGKQQSKEEIIAQAEIIASYHPDILFLQEIHPWQARAVADALYDGGGDYRESGDAAIITRWKVHLAYHNPMKHSQLVTLELPNGRQVECLNFHLRSAQTDMRLWKRSCWQDHSTNRKLQRREVLFSLALLKQQTDFPKNPVVVAGDFNSPASDPLHDILRGDFIDSFGEVGTGWANTWHRRISLHRIDYIYTTPLLRPVRSRTVIVPASDHRMLVSDFLLMP